MCMNKVNFTLVWDEKEKDYIGEGYKSITCLDSKGRINQSVMAKYYSTKKFMEAQPIAKNDIIYALDNKTYANGFHIFLKRGDAEKYGGNTVVKVKFKGVIAFGTNRAGYNSQRNKANYGPCIIASQIKIVGKA